MSHNMSHVPADREKGIDSGVFCPGCDMYYSLQNLYYHLITTFTNFLFYSLILILV